MLGPSIWGHAEWLHEVMVRESIEPGKHGWDVGLEIKGIGKVLLVSGVLNSANFLNDWEAMDVKVVWIVGTTHEFGVTEILLEEFFHGWELFLESGIIVSVLPSATPTWPELSKELVES